MRYLFVCGKARMRSPTAADIAARYPNVETDFAGLSNDADEKLSSEHIDWADTIFVMERRQKKRLTALFGNRLRHVRVVCLDVPDRFAFNQPELCDLLRVKLASYLTE